MQISTRFTLAVHILCAISTFGKTTKVTSEFLASSTNVNPVIVRKILGSLKKAGIVDIRRGSGGAEIIRPLDSVTFLDIYRAVDCVEDGLLFHFHENPNPLCPVGRNIHSVLDGRLDEITKALEKKMESITLEAVISELDSICDK